MMAASYGGAGMVNAGISIVDAIKGTSTPGIIEGVGTHILGR